MTAAFYYQAFADACLDNRSKDDPDVQLVIHEVQKEIELFVLEQQGRLP